MLAVNLFSADDKYDQVYISNYTYINLQQQIARMPGVGNTQIFGERRIRDAHLAEAGAMTALGIASADVITAIEEQNIQAAAGQIGEPPTPATSSSSLPSSHPGG